MRATFLLAAWIPASLLTHTGYGQTAQVSGLVSDASGYGLPDAWITLTKEDTGVRYVSRSSAQGYYFIPATRPGAYRIRVRKDGFQTVVRLGVKLANGLSTRIDFTLQIGIREEFVQVTDRTNPVDTEDATIGTVIGRAMIDRLPLNGRGLLTLLELAPGVIVTPAGSGETGQFSAAGQRADSNSVTLDGVSLNNGIGVIGMAGGRAVQLGGVVPVFTALGTTQSLVSADAIEEFRVQTAGLSADQGRTIGAHVIMTTRSGSNEFHGSISADYRNESLDANNWFSGRSGQPRPRFRMYDFSGAAGGALWRNRTFFFVSSESLRLNHPSVETQYVPTALSRLAAPAGARWLLDALPLPNGPDAGAGLGILTLPAPRSSGADATGVRIDHSAGLRHKIFARFNRAPSSDEMVNPGSLRATRVSVSTDSATGGFDSAVGRTGYHSIRWNWTRVLEKSSTWTETFGRTVDLEGRLPPLSDPQRSTYSLQILSPPITLVTAGASGTQRQWNVVESFSQTRGDHTFAFGADYRHLAPGLSTKPFLHTAVYPDLDAFAAEKPIAMAVSRRNSVSLTLSNFSAFAQDTWRITPGTVLNYGLRWEYNPAPGGRDGAPLFHAVTPGNPPQVRVGQQGRALWSTGWGAAAPRLGIVRRLDRSGRTILRAAGGLLYDPGFASALQAAISEISTNVSLVTSVNGVTATYSDFSSASPALASHLEADFGLPYSIQWNATLDRQVAGGSAASLSWIGSAGRRLLRLEQARTAEGDSLAFYTNHGASAYEAMHAQIRLRPLAGFDALASFTWAHSIDNASRTSDTFLWQPAWPGDIDRGDSSFDVRHSFSIAFTANPRVWRGWSLHGIFRARTGFPLTVTALNPRLAFGIDSRTDLVPEQPVWIGDANSPGGRRLNPRAFRASSLPQPGTLGRNAIQGFGMHQLDLAIQREFRVTGPMKALLRMEAFNALNHPNFGNPDTFLSNPTFGQSGIMLNQFLGTGGPSTGLVPVFQIGGPRSVQIAIRLRF